MSGNALPGMWKRSSEVLLGVCCGRNQKIHQKGRRSCWHDCTDKTWFDGAPGLLDHGSMSWRPCIDVTRGKQVPRR